MNYEPRAPRNVTETGLDPAIIHSLIAKGMFLESLESTTQLAELTKLSAAILDECLQDMSNRKLIESAGMTASSVGMGVLRYQLTTQGKEFAKDALDINQYLGPAPVPLDVYAQQIRLQAIGEERVSQQDIENAFHDIIVPEEFTKRLGPAVNSGMSILIYGPAGNGKTTVAEKVAKIYESIVYIPHSIEVNGNIIKVFDASVHEVVDIDPNADSRGKSVIRRQSDGRYMSCRRPVVITGGELTMEMLDLKFNPISKFYEAPLHMKALNGTFIIDDFGRQIVSPDELLNRWIVPLQSRVDYLRLHSGKSFQIPFDELVIFSTNLAPDDLMDPAFLRRIPYKLETKDPSLDAFKAIYEAVAYKAGLVLDDEIFDYTVDQIVSVSGKTLAAYQPKFIIDQVISACKYEGIPLEFNKPHVADALSNLYVRDTSYQGQVGSTPAQ